MPKPKSTRSRVLPGALLKGNVTGRTSSGVVNLGSGTDSAQGRQITVSEGHHWPPPKGAALSDRGGDFYTTKTYITSKFRDFTLVRVSPPWTYTFKGNITPIPVSTVTVPSAELSIGELDARGATAIARCAPGDPPAQLSTALGELWKDGLPSLLGYQTWKDRTRTAKSASGEYLNVQFGWVPLISDINSVGNSLSKSDDLLTQFEKDSGRVVRRRYRFPLEKTTSESVVKTNTRPSMGGVGTTLFPDHVAQGDVIRRRDTVRQVSFAGAFTYYLPTGYDSRNAVLRAASRYKYLLGLDLNPEVLWNLTPWSWAADWFANGGDVIHNVSRFASQGLIMRYGYVMCHTVVTDTYTFVPKTGITPFTVRIPPLTVVTETKQRRAANPYGFGISWSGLSPFQLSIMAALGINRR